LFHFVGGTLSFSERRQSHAAASGDHFKPALPMSRSHIITTDPHGHGSMIARTLFAHLCLHPFSNRLQVLAYGFMIRRLTDRAHSFNKSTTFSNGISEPHFVSR
jgi:hypothetical protein